MVIRALVGGVLEVVVCLLVLRTLLIVDESKRNKKKDRLFLLYVNASQVEGNGVIAKGNVPSPDLKMSEAESPNLSSSHIRICKP